jgi:hypothetical protein
MRPPRLLIVTCNTLTSGIFRSRNAREVLGQPVARAFSQIRARPEFCQPIIGGEMGGGVPEFPDKHARG